ncbi:hypothetical protein CAOG_08379 [Capsaspora owczarzaki ATCC 30864]|nr:hypothetical protein CAOG_08379 [Capsaspora owczarzaki ATCC 30864]|eukprot:XP_004339905.1 hypothetical protein CAOG_08379 [Capsaspora owczarzaki ATCC 30864]
MLPVPGRLRTARGLRALLIVTMVAIIILHGFPSVLKVQIWRGMRLSDALELAVPLIVCALLFTLMHAQVTGVRQTLGAMADMLRGRRSRQNSDKPWRDGGANQEELRPMPANLDLPPSAQADPAAGGGGLLSSDSSVLVPEPRALAAGYSVTMLELLCFVIPAAIYATGHGAHTFANRIKGLLKTEVPETSNVFIVADFLDEKLSHYVSMAGLYLMLLALVWR